MSSTDPVADVSDARDVPGLVLQELRRQYAPEKELNLKYASRRFGFINGQFAASFLEKNHCVLFLQEGKRICRLILAFCAPDDESDDSAVSGKGRLRLLEPSLIISGGLFMPLAGVAKPEMTLKSAVRFLAPPSTSRPEHLEFLGTLITVAARIVGAANYERVCVSQSDLREARILDDITVSYLVTDFNFGEL